MTEENKKGNRGNSYLYELLMLLVTLICISVFSFINKCAMITVIRNTVTCGMLALLIQFLMELASEKKSYDYDNSEYRWRFPLAYLICLILSCAFAFLPSGGWPFLVIFVVLSLFSNTLIGILCGTLFLTASVLISGAGVEIFVLYFVVGVISVCLFKGIDDSYKIGMPVTLSIFFLLTAQTANVVLFTNETLHINLFLIPFLNVLINIVLLLICLKVFSAFVIFKNRDKYMEINDPEFTVLVELKEKSKEEYYHAVHTAYFCDRIAHKLALDADSLKASGYYHKIGILKNANTWEQVEEIAKSYSFPKEVNEILKEYLNRNVNVTKKETAVLIMSDAIVASMQFLFERNKNEPIDYDQVIDTVFKKKFENKMFQNCNITLEEINIMKKIFKEEKLYYDFLR